jgi:hypothetical protein
VGLRAAAWIGESALAIARPGRSPADPRHSAALRAAMVKQLAVAHANNGPAELPAQLPDTAVAKAPRTESGAPDERFPREHLAPEPVRSGERGSRERTPRVAREQHQLKPVGLDAGHERDAREVVW